MKRWIGALAACSLITACGSSTTRTVISTVSNAGSGTSTATASSAATTSTTTSETAATSTPLHLSTFRSPSANIGCELVAGFARCDIAKRSWKPPPKPSRCPLDYGQGVEVGRSGDGHLVCAGDTALNPQARPLAYGQSSRVAPITCTSATAGMTCTNSRTGHGFFISIQSYKTF